MELFLKSTRSSVPGVQLVADTGRINGFLPRRALLRLPVPRVTLVAGGVGKCRP